MKDQRLREWMEEVVGILCYQPDIPQARKADLLKAMQRYNEAFDKPDRPFEPADVSDDVVGDIEFAVGMGCGAWDGVPPKEIIAAAWNLIPNKKDNQL